MLYLKFKPGSTPLLSQWINISTAVSITIPHSPARFRVIGPLRNLDAWYAAFNIKPGAALYLEPAKRVRIW